MKEVLIVEGKNRLTGEVTVSGAKNASLVIICASLLAEGETVLENIPDIRDVDVLCHILNHLGVQTKRNSQNNLVIETSNLKKKQTPYELTNKLRASNLLLGPLLGKLNEVTISMPGGCNIGNRPMDLHIKGLQKLGAKINVEHGYITAKAKRLQGSQVYLDFPSVGATENIMMAACLSEGITIIDNAAREPEIVDLQNFLNKMGAKIRGSGTDVIKIEGVKKLSPVHYAVIPDRIETGTFIAASAITGGEISIRNIIPTHISPVVAKFQEMGVRIVLKENELIAIGPRNIKPTDIKTLPYPGFPSDMQSQAMAVLTQGRGASIIVENIFENRFQLVSELKRMGADIKVEGHMAIINGQTPLHGARVKATDLRAGASLILAGLIAEGPTEIECSQYIFRGYEKIECKFRKLGARIRQVPI